MLNPRPITLTHEAIFIERYEQLRSWALRLTGNDHQKAEDLVQEAFIHFTLARPELQAIINLEGYLYNVLRNLHLSQERHTSRRHLQQLSIFDYDTLELALRVVDSVDRLQVQDELRQVCHFSCVRKETARTASILILRFFHGYYPSEIAQIALTNRRAVDERLRIARSEARLYLDAPDRLRFIKTGVQHELTRTDSVQDVYGLLNELHQMIFNSRQGACLERTELEEIYKGKGRAQISTRLLAHIVSCRVCLEAVNALLGISSLNDRHPPDMIGKDSLPKGQSRGGARSRTKGGGHTNHFDKYRRRAREVYEHRPQELYFLVNGFILGSQKINSELSEQALSISMSEGVGFVEVCSEQDVRLLFLNIEPPPAGVVKQPVFLELSDERSLELTLKFDDKWPSLHSAYYDPLMKPGALDVETSAEMIWQTAGNETSVEPNAAGWFSRNRLADFVKRAWRHSMLGQTWLWPGIVTAVLSVLLIGALAFMKMRAPAVNATELLQRSMAAEEKQFGNTDTVFHRRLRFEQWGDNGNRLLARSRIEVWQSPARELTTRRVFDEQSNLISGEWIRANGTSTLYQHGIASQERTAPAAVARALIETGEIWRLEASAKDFSALVGAGAYITAREDFATYTIEFRDTTADDTPTLVFAALTLRKSDLSAIEQRLVVEHVGQRREYRLSEELFEKYPKSHVGRSFFIPDAELLGPPEKKELDAPRDEDGATGAQATVSEAPARAASPELEIEVTYLLNQIKANLGEQVTMTRTTGGTLRVEALVETEGRKEEILRALSPIIGNPAVRVEVRTIGEATRSQQARPKQPGMSEREVVVSNNRIPAYAELRIYFSRRVVGDEAIDAEINRYGNRVMYRSRQALLHASALRRLAVRFSPEELDGLAPEARAKWLAMVREHALVYQREVLALRQELRPVFGGFDESAPAVAVDGDVKQWADRLLQLSYATDETVRSEFTISAGGGSNASAIKSRPFWRQLMAAEKLALGIQDRYQR